MILFRASLRCFSFSLCVASWFMYGTLDSRIGFCLKRLDVYGGFVGFSAFPHGVLAALSAVVLHAKMEQSEAPAIWRRSILLGVKHEDPSITTSTKPPRDHPIKQPLNKKKNHPKTQKKKTRLLPRRRSTGRPARATALGGRQHGGHGVLGRSTATRGALSGESPW